MKSFGLAIWRFVRVFVAGAFAVVVILPSDKWLSKETLAVAVGAGIVAVSKYLREEFGFDLRIV